MNTEIIVIVNNVYKAESVFSHDGNAVFRINMLCVSINKTTNYKYIGGNISVFENQSRR